MATQNGRKRHPTAVRRRLIIEHASALIAENGLAGTGAREIALAAGVSTGTVTYHFSSVDEILIEAVRSAMAAVAAERRRRTESCDTSLDRILAYVGVCFDEDVHPPSAWLLWLDCWARATRQAELRRYQVRYYRRLYADLAGFIRDGTAAGEFAEESPEDCARELVALVDGLGEQMVTDPALAPARARAIVESAVRRRLGAAPPQRPGLAIQP
jgi:AcrR family transcriptional regulator